MGPLWGPMWLGGAALAVEPTVGGVLRPEVAFDVPGAAQRHDGEFTPEVNTFGRAFARGELKNGDAWFFEVRIQHHLWVPATTTFGDNAPTTEAWWDLQVGETGIDAKIAGPVRLRVGALVERWGKLDLLPVADVLNPRDGRSGPMTPVEYQRIPIPMATVQVGNDTIRSETSLIPFSTADRLWLRETDWSYVRQGWLDPYLGEMEGWTDDNGDTPQEWSEFIGGKDGLRASMSQNPLDPSLRRGLDAAVNTKGLPEALIANGEIAERVEIRARNLDVGVMGAYMRSRQPLAVLDPDLARVLSEEVATNNPQALFETTVQPAVAGGPIDVAWPRTIVAGADASMLAGPVQLRAETMWWSDRVVREPWGQARTLPQLGAGLGVDYVRGGAFQVTLEGRWLHLFDAPERMVFSLPDQIQLAGGLRWSVARERVILQLGGAWDLSFSEGLVRPSVAYRPVDAVQLELGALVLGGTATPPPEGMRDALTYQGGPLSYWSKNDAITMAVTLIK
jgi:hypothetical protein